MSKKLFNKDFILMLQGNAISAIGDILYSVAIGYWVYEKTGSSTLMGIMSSVSMFVVMFMAPFSGTIVDKCERKSIIVGMDVLRGIIMLVIGILAYLNQLSVPIVVFAAFLASLCSAFFRPAVSTLMIDIIPHDDMVRGQSISSGVSSFVSLIDEAFSGALVALCGVPFIIILNGISYLISAVTEMFIDVPKTKGQGEKVTLIGILKDFKIGFLEIFQNRFLKLFIPVALITNLLGSGVFSLMMPFILEKGFTVDMYGYLMALQTAASLICVFLLGIIKLKPKLRYYGMCLGFVTSVIFYIGGYITNNYILMCVLMFLGSFMNVLGNSIFNASLMLALPEENRGSILGFVSSGSTGGCALSVILYGILCDIFPIYLVFIVGNILTMLPMLYLCLHRDTKEFVLSH